MAGKYEPKEAVTLAEPKEDAISIEHLKKCDGSNPDYPILVAIKGTVFDVSHKTDTYGPGGGYHVFAGKDASCGLGKSSLKAEDAHSDYSQLNETETKTLNDWFTFFSKRYNIVGKVTEETSASL